MFNLYLITNLVNQKIYIGVTKNINIRWATHKRIAVSGKNLFPHHYQPLHQGIAKYGVDNFIIEIIQVFSSEDEAYTMEEWWISYLRYMAIPIYNIAGGGKGTGSGENHPMFGKKLPEEWKNKVAATSKISSNLPELKVLRRQNMLKRNWNGSNHPNFGKTTSKETADKISKKLVGKKFSKEHKDAIGNSLTGKPKSEEHKKNISLSKMGKYFGTNNPNAKLSIENIKQILQLLQSDLSANKIGKIFNVSKTTILRYKKLL